jgi:hypothetical protein
MDQEVEERSRKWERMAMSAIEDGSDTREVGNGGEGRKAGSQQK